MKKEHSPKKNDWDKLIEAREELIAEKKAENLDALSRIADDDPARLERLLPGDETEDDEIH